MMKKERYGYISKRMLNGGYTFIWVDIDQKEKYDKNKDFEFVNTLSRFTKSTADFKKGFLSK